MGASEGADCCVGDGAFVECWRAVFGDCFEGAVELLVGWRGSDSMARQEKMACR